GNIFLQALLRILKTRGFIDQFNILKNANCEFDVSSTFSRVRWNGYSTTVIFRLPMVDYEKLGHEDHEFKTPLIQFCDELIPRNAGLDILNVEFLPTLDSDDTSDDVEDDFNNAINELTQQPGYFSLPDDIKQKGHEMAKAYFYLYIIENYLRLFIDKVLIEKYGSVYLEQAIVPRSISNGIKARRDQERKNLWIGVRGDTDLFYIDFKDLGLMIKNNWDAFKNYFPDEAWITTKIDEMGDCRNLVAHNSVIGKHERDVIRTNFISITRQLSNYMNNQ
ncbi:MAG: hypothetical protein LUQ65_14005, partial [Candidatus Helarchaeota archaeon]|nr:hypothetical protein [Candidatus Helarchaeota archaeon]